MKLVISRSMAAAFAAAVIISGGNAVAAELPEDANPTCPVMLDEAVDSDLFVDYKGKSIYLCCTKCKRQFLKDPEKYMPGIKMDNSQTTQARTVRQPPKP